MFVMDSTIKAQLDAVHPRMLRVRGEGDPQELGRRAIGVALESALARASITKQAAAFDMGYTDSGVISRWINGTENAQVGRLWMLGQRFQQEFAIALAEQIQGLDVKTTVTIARVA